MNTCECTFRCPLPNGLHARPASQLAAEAVRFEADISLTNERTGATANAKSSLAIVGLDVRLDDNCSMHFTGANAEAAYKALGVFVAEVLPGCDEPLPTVSHATAVVIPHSLRKAISRWQEGTIACSGIGQGFVVTCGAATLPKTFTDMPAESPEQEREKVRHAVAGVRFAIETRLAARPSAVEKDILQAHQSIAGDISLIEKIDAQLASGRSAGYAIVQAAEFFTAQLRASENAYVRERAVDVEDICLQLLERIYGDSVKPADIELTRPSVIVAENLTPRQFLALDKQHLKALALEHGGTTSHVVILARSFNIPTLCGVSDMRKHILDGQEVIVDANVGIVVSEISDSIKRYYEREQHKLSRRQERLARFTNCQAATIDGKHIEVAANVATVHELGPAFAQGADGIGLFRTEMLFMDRESPPSEEEQFAIYVQAAKAACGKPVIIRTVDIGGDKPVSYLNIPPEENPFLGYRGARIYPDHQDVFRSQMRAIIRASAFGNVWVMAPMICAIEEVRWIRKQIAEIHEELKATHEAFAPNMPVGIMIEIPSVAFLVDQLATEVDFFSIGTNDLAQYFLAVDRGSNKVADLYNVRHPAFLRLLAKIADDAHRHNRWLGMCGEMAKSLQNLPLLIGLGLNEISMAAPSIPAVKAAIAKLSEADCRATLKNAMACSSASDVEKVLAASSNSAGSQELLDKEHITFNADVSSKEEAIKEIIDSFYVTGRTDRPGTVEEAVWAREAVYSTGLGHGFAIPHCKTDAIAANSIGFARLAQPIEWGSLDDQPVRCVIMLAIRESDQDNTHMKIFSKLARKLMHEEFREHLLAATDNAAIKQFLAEELGISTEQPS